MIQHLKLAARCTVWLALVLVLSMGLASRAIAIETSPQSLPETPSTYFLSLSPEGIRHQINLKSPAAHVVIRSESGDTAIPCGDGIKTYSCIPGNTLEIHYASAAVTHFWAQNTSTSPVRLRIEILAASGQTR